MKKLLTLVAIAGLFTTASATDRAGKLGLGFQESITDGTLVTSPNSLGTWSLKYGFSPSVNAQLVAGFDFGNKTVNDRFNVGVRLLADLVENENSDFYSGIGVIFDNQDKGDRALRVNVPLGFEWSFAGLPEIGFSAEAGINLDFIVDGPVKPVKASSVGGLVGGNLGLGVHYYF